MATKYEINYYIKQEEVSSSPTPSMQTIPLPELKETGGIGRIKTRIKFVTGRAISSQILAKAVACSQEFAAIQRFLFSMETLDHMERIIGITNSASMPLYFQVKALGK